MAAYDDVLDDLTGADRDAAAALIDLFSSYGLQTLAGRIVNFIREGWGGATITVMLQETPEYKRRFAGNEARKKAGLPALSPAEYISTERTYRQILAAAGMPKGFYDHVDDFRKWIESDVSPQEIQGRVEMASRAAQNVDPKYRETLRRYYGVGDADIAAFFLDQKRALPLIEKMNKVVDAGAAAARQGFNVDKNRIVGFVDRGISAEQVGAGYAAINEFDDDARDLATIDKTTYSLADAEAEVFEQNADAKKKRTKLASNERARFSGGAGVGNKSLSKGTSGQY